MMIRSLIAFLVLILAVGESLARDKDKDGIPNKYDECRKKPEDKDGFEDTDGCPDYDNDGDGICDPHLANQGGPCTGSDQCISVPEDKDNFEDGDGCPDPDNDKDGTPDKHDKCPNEPEDRDGFQDSDGCPDADNDKDGIPDTADKCPVDAEDNDGLQDDDGCPETDGDGDGIKDEVDRCPREPENINGRDDEDGCPDRDADALRQSESWPLVRFRIGTPELIVEAEPTLAEFAKKLVAYPESRVQIRVFDSYKGGEKADYLGLLARQSQAIVDALVSKGAQPSQIDQVAYTEENMEALKDTPNDFNTKRPVEVHLLTPQ